MHTRLASGVLLAAILAFSIASMAVAARPAFAQSETKGQSWSSMNTLAGDAEKTFETDKAGALAKIDQAERGWRAWLLPGWGEPEPSWLRTHPVTEERIRRLLALELPSMPGHTHAANFAPAVAPARGVSRWRPGGLGR